MSKKPVRVDHVSRAHVSLTSPGPSREDDDWSGKVISEPMAAQAVQIAQFTPLPEGVDGLAVRIKRTLSLLAAVDDIVRLNPQAERVFAAAVENVAATMAKLAGFLDPAGDAVPIDLDPGTTGGCVAPARGHLVYQAFDKYDQILYVGVTDNLFSRMGQHSTNSKWWPLMHHLQWENQPDRPDALRRERALIRELNPPFNSAHRTTRRFK